MLFENTTIQCDYFNQGIFVELNIQSYAYFRNNWFTKKAQYVFNAELHVKMEEKYNI